LRLTRIARHRNRDLGGRYRHAKGLRACRLYATPGAIRVLTSAGADPVEYIARHLSGDWGDLDADDSALNDRALQLGERLISVYRLANGEKIWIVTEADRSATTIRLPAEH
jgi:hypothetical protein